MSFTLKCDVCGNERKVENGSKREENKIDIWATYYEVGFDCWICNENELTIK